MSISNTAWEYNGASHDFRGALRAFERVSEGLLNVSKRFHKCLWLSAEIHMGFRAVPRHLRTIPKASENSIGIPRGFTGFQRYATEFYFSEGLLGIAD